MKLLSAITICLLLFINCKQSSKEINIVYAEGGYSYPTHVEDKDTTLYSYPLKDTSPPFDSILNFETSFLLRLFDEPNLSLNPQKTSVFRLTYIGWGYSTIINLTPYEIIVKKQTKLWRYPLHDTSRLNEKEKEDFNNYEFLATFFNSSSDQKWYRDQFDSLSKSIPQLSDINYYLKLKYKSADAGDQKLEYSIKKIPIKLKTFLYLVNLINESGYWQMPPEHNCGNIPTDASTYILEANTKAKYKFVSTIECYPDNSKYAKACQELIKYAKADDEIHLPSENGAATTETPVNARELKLEPLKEKKPQAKIKKKKAQ